MDETRPKGSGLFYLVALVATGVSVDTSWRFFGEKLGITNPVERVALFAVLELMLVACGWAMRAGVRRSGHPGSARFIAWALCAMSGYMALDLSGPMQGLARVVLGPVLAIVALHQALGIEIKARIGQRTGTWARIGRELRERVLSRLGLADDARDALQRTRERAAIKAATIATSRNPSSRNLRKAVLKAGPDQRELILDTVASLRHLDSLATVDMDNPWTRPSVQPVQDVPVPRPRTAPTSGGPAIGWDVDKVVVALLRNEDAAGLASPKSVQRVRRVLSALAAGQDMATIVRGDMTLKFATTVQAAWRKAMEATA